MKNEIIGSLNLITLELFNSKDKIDLKKIFISMNIYEDLFSKFLTGKIVLMDTHDLISFFPIEGVEKIKISFNTLNDNTNMKTNIFSVYKLEQDVQTFSNFENRKIIILYLCSPEKIKNEQITLSKTLKSSCENFYRTSIKTYLNSSKNITIDNFIRNKKNIFNVICNFWTFDQVIDYITDIDGNNGEVLFFEDLTGFNVMSILTLLDNKPTHYLVMKEDQSMLFDSNFITQFKMNEYFNLLNSLKNGVFGNTVYELNNNYYGFKKTKTDNHNVRKYLPSLGKNVNLPEEYLNNSKKIITFKNGRKLSLKDQMFKTLMNYHLIIKIVGDSTKSIGQIFNIDFRKISLDNELNQYLMGNWLVTNINHEILNTGKYIQNIKIIKNAFTFSKSMPKIIGKGNV